MALDESREQIQALLDFCFTDRSKWREGRKESIRDEDNINSEDSLPPIPSLSSGELPYPKNE